MTVAQLIEHLKTLPQDAEVVTWIPIDPCDYGDYESVEAKDVTYNNFNCPNKVEIQ